MAPLDLTSFNDPAKNQTLTNMLSAPESINALWLLAALAALTLLAKRKQRSGWILLGRLDNPPSLRLGTVILAFASLVVAAARPMGSTKHDPLQVSGRDVVFAIDVSRSMASTDAFPTRLAAAQSIARDLLDSILQGSYDRAALVAFAGRAVVRCPLTENLGAVHDAIDRLMPDSVQPGGTDIGAALSASLAALDDQVPSDGQTVIVISDGEDHAGRWREPLKRCQDQRVIVHGLTIGDDLEGALLPDKPHRDPIITKRTDSVLQTIAEKCGGALVPVGTQKIDAHALARDQLTPGAARMRERAGWVERVELYGWFAGPALLLLGLHSTRLNAWNRRAPIGWLILACIVPTMLGAGSGDDPGMAAFRRGDYAAALKHYQELRRRQPKVAALFAYNEAAALFRLNRFEDALAAYDSARSAADPRLRAKTQYARGNTLVALGRYEEAIEAYDACLATPLNQTDSARLFDDARVNRDFAIAQLTTPEPTRPEAVEEPPPSGDDSPDAKPQSPSTNNKINEAPTQLPSPARTAADATPLDEPPPIENPEDLLTRSINRIQDSKTSRLNEAPPNPSHTNLPDW